MFREMLYLDTKRCTVLINVYARGVRYPFRETVRLIRCFCTLTTLVAYRTTIHPQTPKTLGKRWYAQIMHRNTLIKRYYFIYINNTVVSVKGRGEGNKNVLSKDGKCYVAVVAWVTVSLNANNNLRAARTADKSWSASKLYKYICIIIKV